MEIVSFEEGSGGVVIYMKGMYPEDPDLLWCHVVPTGILEQRAEAWQLPDDIDPIDVLMVESYHAPDEMPEFLFDDPDYLGSREKVLGLVRKHRGKVTGLKKEAQEACALPREEALKLRRRLRTEFDDRMAAPAQPATTAFESSQRLQSGLKEVRLGFERRGEELLADEIIRDNPALKQEPRVQDSETVGLTVKFV
jgi:hypothetical protein